MPDALQISMMSFRSQDVTSHPWVGRQGEVFLETGDGWRLTSVEDTIILLSQFSCIGFRIFNQFRIVDISLKDCYFNHLQLLVLDSLWYIMTMVRWKFQVSNNRKVVRNHIWCWCRENITPLEKIKRSRVWPRMWVGKFTNWSKDCKISVRWLISDDEESIRSLKSPSSARSWGSEAI